MSSTSIGDETEMSSEHPGLVAEMSSAEGGEAKLNKGSDRHEFSRVNVSLKEKVFT